MSQDHLSEDTHVLAGVLSALWPASGYLTAFRYALHTMYGLPDHRPPLRGAHPHPLPHRAPH